MASVTSLDRDLRKMRLDKYTPAAANEVKAWIEGVLGERLPAGDLLQALKDGVALCKLVNLGLPPPGVKFKTSSMPFVQMENISHFLRACKSPPYNLQEHDMFLTVDLYEAKDPAQVLQCLGAFSRAANLANGSAFPTAIGPRANPLVPQKTGYAGTSLSPTPTAGSRPRGLSSSSNGSSGFLSARAAPLVASKTGDSGSGRWSPNKSPQSGPKSPSVSSWSSRAHERGTSPAWNIAQYGYMGGASQGNLGISFGGRRQITSAAPSVPSLAEKEKLRKEKEAEDERQRQEELARRRAVLEAEEERARLEEERKWAEETKRQREAEARRVAEEKRRWEEEERQWKITEENRRREEEEAERRLAQERAKVKSNKGDARLHGQLLSQYQAEHGGSNGAAAAGAAAAMDPDQRIRQLEAELERARQREAEYENERQNRLRLKTADAKSRARSRSRPRPSSGTPSRQDSWAVGDDSDGEGLKKSRNARPLPDPTATPPPPIKSQHTGGSSSRPLPDPRAYSSPPQPSTPSPRMTRVAATPSPVGGVAKTTTTTSARSTPKSSLLEREMELERQRQREWEEAQKETAKTPRSRDGSGVDGIGGGVGGRWDVGQWAGFTGGDNQNRGTQGIGAGRRQIAGPRPLPGAFPGSPR